MKKFYISLLIFILFWGLKIVNAQVGSSCVDPYLISSLPFSQIGLNTSTVADNYDTGPCTASNAFMAGNDFVFTYTPFSNEVVNISLANVSSVYGSGIFVTDSCPDNLNSTCIAQANSTIAIPTPSISTLNLTAGTQYFFIVSTQVISIFGQPFGQTTGFDISIQPCNIIPAANFTFIQNGFDVSFTNTSTNGETYQWLFGDEFTHNWFLAVNDTNPVHTYPGYGTYTVEMVATSSCGSTDTIAVDITLTCPGPVPSASFTYSANNTTVTFTNTSTNAATSSWLFGDEGLFPPGDPTTNPVHFYTQAGTYIVELTITTDSGCLSVFTDTITVTCNLTSIPVANFTYTAVDTTVSFTNISVDATNYSWLFGDEPPFPPATGDTTTNPVHTYSGWGTYDVQLTASNCFASTTITIPIFICNTTTLPTADFTYSQTGMDVSFTNTSSGNNTYQWLFGDVNIPPPLHWINANTEISPVHTYPGYGTYTIEMVATNLCGITDTLVIDITLSCPGPVPSASFTYTADNTTVTFTNTSTNAATSSWLYGDEPIFPIPTGDTTENPVHPYSQAGTYTVELTITSDSGCQSVFTDTIVLTCNLTSVPVASFNYSISDTTVTFNNTSVDGSTYLWLFGDEFPSTWLLATSGANQVHQYNGSGTYTVQMIAANCFSSDTITFDIVICAMPNASFTNSITDMNVNFQSTATYTVSHQWFFGDEINGLPSDTVANPSHTYVNYGSYNVTYVAINECGTDTQKTIINILCINNASFTYVNNQGTVQFTSTATGNSLTYNWFFGDETNPNIPSEFIANPTHIYTQGGTYTVRMITSNNCGTDTAYTSITIVGIDQLNNKINVSFYPNPVKDVLFIELYDLAGEKLQLSVQNILGNEIHNETLVATTNTYRKQLIFKELSKGVYLIKVNSNKDSKIVRIISE